MKKKAEADTPTLEPPKEDNKIYEIVYPYVFQGETYPVRIKFLNKIVTKDEMNRQCVIGFLEIFDCNMRGTADVQSHFNSEVLNTYYKRKQLEELFEAEICIQREC